MRIRFFAFGAVLATLCGLRAQTGLTLAEAIRQAQSAHPALQSAQSRIDAAQGLRTQASLRLNPRFLVQTENLRAWGAPPFSFPNDTDDFLTLTQVFEMGGKRAARIDAAAAAVRTAEVERAVAARQIAARVSAAYWSAVASASLHDLLQKDLENFERIVQYHRDRVREGAMAEVDLMRVLLERDRLSLSVHAAAQESARHMISLLREMGRSDFTPVPLAGQIADVQEQSVPGIDTVLAQRPEVEAARRLVEQARANHRLQQALARPDPEVTFGYKRTAGFDTLMGAVQIDLPFRNRNQGNIAAASAAIREAEAQLVLTQNAIRAEVAAAVADYQLKRRVIEEVLIPMRSRADEVSAIAQAAYREGGADLLRLLDAERARIESLTLYYRALSEYQHSVTTLRIVTGAPL